jgi:hypothetical protein
VMRWFRGGNCLLACRITVSEHRSTGGTAIDGDGDVDDGRLSEGTGLSVLSREL